MGCVRPRSPTFPKRKADLIARRFLRIGTGLDEAAEERRCDLIVMASHGRRGVSAVVLGSETVKVLTI